MLINREGFNNDDTKNFTYGIDCALYWNVKTTTGYVNNTSSFNLAWEDDTSTESNLTWIDASNLSLLILIPFPCVVNGTRVQPKNGTDTFYMDNCTYTIAKETNKGLQAMLRDPWFGLNGKLDFMRTDPDTGGAVWNKRNAFIMNLEMATAQATPEQALSIATVMWQDIARFAGNTVRSAESAQLNGTFINLEVQGTMSDLVTYYSIDWARLAAPAFIVLSCALFMVYTAILTRREYACRRSALPLLFHGLEDHERHAQGDVRDFNAMQDAAKDVHVRLTEHVDDTGARLTTQRR